jgi:hypothetical protein
MDIALDLLLSVIDYVLDIILIEPATPQKRILK